MKHLFYILAIFLLPLTVTAQQTGIRIGDVIPDISGEGPEMEKFHIQDLRGKVVLVDFWASWCKSCRMEIPYLIAAYEKYHAKGLQVVGIAVWDKPEDSLRAISQDKPTYPQIINSQSIATDIYGINAIPEIMLFAPDGTILARWLHDDMIEMKLAEIFSADK